MKIELNHIYNGDCLALFADIDHIEVELKKDKNNRTYYRLIKIVKK